MFSYIYWAVETEVCVQWSDWSDTEDHGCIDERCQTSSAFNVR